MNIPILGSLVEVDLREAWNHEAHSFTPWLAEHLEVLSAQIGMPLELEGIEVAVDTFSADILARNTDDDSLVLIENQLEGTDHAHLGQIMTYLAGLETHTVIWIAASFREAHLSALKWLNEHTVEPFAFFAVRVRAVRIGESPIAPIFEVLSRPNHWERKLQSIAQETRPMSAIGQFRKEFWTHYLNRFPDELVHESLKGVSARWRKLAALDLIIVLYLAKDGVGIFIRGAKTNADAADVANDLGPYIDLLTERLGVGLGTSNQGYFFMSKRKAITTQKELWDELSDWLHQRADSYEAALYEIMGELREEDVEIEAVSVEC